MSPVALSLSLMLAGITVTSASCSRKSSPATPVSPDQADVTNNISTFTRSIEVEGLKVILPIMPPVPDSILAPEADHLRQLISVLPRRETVRIVVVPESVELHADGTAMCTLEESSNAPVEMRVIRAEASEPGTVIFTPADSGPAQNVFAARLVFAGSLLELVEKLRDVQWLRQQKLFRWLSLPPYDANSPTAPVDPVELFGLVAPVTADVADFARAVMAEITRIGTTSGQANPDGSLPFSITAYHSPVRLVAQVSNGEVTRITSINGMEPWAFFGELKKRFNLQPR